MHQIFQGNCGGASVEDVLRWYRMNLGSDNLDQAGSPDQALWDEWMAARRRVAG